MEDTGKQDISLKPIITNKLGKKEAFISDGNSDGHSGRRAREMPPTDVRQEMRNSIAEYSKGIA